MYAVIKTGGRQYTVRSGEKLIVERLAVEKGEQTSFAVLAVGSDAGIKVGTPTLEGASVKAEVLDHIKGDKIIIFKKKRRHNYRRKNGHRQPLTLIKIGDIAA